MEITRRAFVQDAAVLALGTAAMPSSVADPTWHSGVGKRLVVIFQRGGADALNLVVPYGDPLYYRMRPTIALPRTSVLDLDDYFGLHPAMDAFKQLWDDKRLAIVTATGLPHETRSHFDAQDYMESGMPGRKPIEDGWLNRAISDGGSSARCRAVTAGPTVPLTLAGPSPVIAPTKAAGTFAERLRKLAQRLKADSRLEFAFADMGGWDHHANEGSTQGQLANLAREFSQPVAAFWHDLGALAEETVIVTMSEFGRTARENGSRGTDHGHGGVMFVIGGPVKGGKIYGRWPGLDERHLYEGRGLEVTTDFRGVLCEALKQQSGAKDLTKVFPGFRDEAPLKLFG